MGKYAQKLTFCWALFCISVIFCILKLFISNLLHQMSLLLRGDDTFAKQVLTHEKERNHS